MRSSFSIGQVSGIPIKVHPNWLFTAVLVVGSLAGGFFPQNYPNREVYTYLIFGVFTALLFFGSVLLHELGHSLVAQHEGVSVRSITLFIFGGVAHISREPSTPGAEFRIVAAGPLTSLLLGVFFWAMGIATEFYPELSGACFYLSRINLILAAFNMIPGFPLDGGRILRSTLWYLRKNFRWATRWAVNIGIFIAAVFLFSGIILVVRGEFFTGLWIGFIGWYLLHAARESYRQSVIYGTMNQPNALRRRFDFARILSVLPITRKEPFRPALVYVDPRDQGKAICGKSGDPDQGEISGD